MKCKVCSQSNMPNFRAKILNKYEVMYYFCAECQFLQTEKPFWLEESYQDSINISDTGIMARSIHLSKITTLLICCFFDKNKVFLDYAGGYGFFTRLMRDIGFNFYWHDKYSKNLVARGFEYNEGLEVELLTTFESFEHFEYPLAEIEKMLSISDNLFFSTELYRGEAPPSNDWEYYGFGHGQHISFYSIKTLRYIAEKYNMNLYSNGSSLHLLTKKRLSNFKFNIVIRMHKIGVLNMISRLMRSKTIDDWKLLK